MTTDEFLAGNTRLASRQGDWAGWQDRDEQHLDAATRWLGVLAAGWAEHDLQRVIDAYGAVSLLLPENVDGVLMRMGATRLRA